jgi:hypothetical protein
MAKAYIYLYSGFPADRADKYYVCKYGKGRPITYQVVPHLQRHFDAQGREHKETLDYERFKELRRAGHLYTGKRSKKRSPMFGDLNAEELPGPWRPLGRWLSGDVSPGDVDWRKLGCSLRECMQRHPRMPGPVRRRLDAMSGPDGQFASEAWARLRRQHLERAWYHHWPDGRLADMQDAPGVWEPEVLLKRLKTYERGRGIPADDGLPEASGAVRLGEFPLGPLRKWTSTVALQWPEAGMRRAAATGAGLNADAAWSAILETLPPPGDRHETVGGNRIPVETLYDVQWEMAHRLEASPWAASPWAASGQPGLVSRWHAGACSGIVVTMKWRETPDDLRERLEGWLSTWSDQATNAAVEILLDDGDIAVGSPMFEALTEVSAAPLDTAISDDLEAWHADALTWRFCRMGRRIIVSSRQHAGSKDLMQVRRRVLERVDEHGFEIAENETSTFGDKPTALDVGDTAIPINRQRTCDRELNVDNPGERRFAEWHERTGDPRWATLADPDLRRTFQGLAAALTLRDFTTDVLKGWYGTLYDETELP